MSYRGEAVPPGDGDGDAPFGHETIARLTEPFDPSLVKINPKGMKYVAQDVVIRRLNDVLGMDWGFDIRGVVPSTPGFIVVHGRLFVGGEFRDAFGAAEIQETRRGSNQANWEFAYKTACTDALKVAAHFWGVALELYGDDTRQEAPARASGASAPQQARSPAPQANVQQGPAQAARGASARKTEDDLGDEWRIPAHWKNPPGCLHVQIRGGKHVGKTYAELLESADGRSYIEWGAVKAERPFPDSMAVWEWFQKWRAADLMGNPQGPVEDDYGFVEDPDGMPF